MRKVNLTTFVSGEEGVGWGGGYFHIAKYLTIMEYYIRL